MTLSKLAKLANVSVSVVSKAFSGRSDVSDQMREHVFAVAKEYGCFEQFYHVPYDRPVVAFIIPEVISQHYIRYMECLKTRMEENGYTMLLSISNFDSRMVYELTRYYTEHGKVDGLVCMGTIPKLDIGSDTVLISVGLKACENGFANKVGLDIRTGIDKAIKYLKECGHTRIAYVGEAFTETKREILSSVMRENGLELKEEYAICSRFRFEEVGKDGVDKLIALDEKPSAIIGAYGYITKGILARLEERGMAVPDDISVISMDDAPSPLHFTLDVSCIPCDTEKVCDAIIELFGRQITDKKNGKVETVEIPASFYIGNTIKS